MSATVKPEELAAEWGVSVRTVTRRCVSGELRAFRVGDLWRIPRTAVDEYERSHAPTADNATGVVAEPTRLATPATETNAPHIAVVRGPVPWRSEIVESHSNRAANKKKARVSGN